MASRRPLVVSQNGELEEVQDSDELDIPSGGSSSDFQVHLTVAGGNTVNQGKTMSSTTPDLTSEDRLYRDALPSSFTATMIAYAVQSASRGGTVTLEANQGGLPTVIGTVTIPIGSSTDSFSSDITSGISGLGSGIWDLEIFTNKSSSGGTNPVLRKLDIIISGN